MAQTPGLCPCAGALWQTAGATATKSTSRGVRSFCAQRSAPISRKVHANVAPISTGGGRACVLQGIESQRNCDRDPCASWDRKNASGIRPAKTDLRDQTPASQGLIIERSRRLAKSMADRPGRANAISTEEKRRAIRSAE